MEIDLHDIQHARALWDSLLIVLFASLGGFLLTFKTLYATCLPAIVARFEKKCSFYVLALAMASLSWLLLVHFVLSAVQMNPTGGSTSNNIVHSGLSSTVEDNFTAPSLPAERANDAKLGGIIKKVTTAYEFPGNTIGCRVYRAGSVFVTFCFMGFVVCVSAFSWARNLIVTKFWMVFSIFCGIQVALFLWNYWSLTDTQRQRIFSLLAIYSVLGMWFIWYVAFIYTPVKLSGLFSAYRIAPSDAPKDNISGSFICVLNHYNICYTNNTGSLLSGLVLVFSLPLYLWRHNDMVEANTPDLMLAYTPAFLSGSLLMLGVLSNELRHAVLHHREFIGKYLRKLLGSPRRHVIVEPWENAIIRQATSKILYCLIRSKSQRWKRGLRVFFEPTLGHIIVSPDVLCIDANLRADAPIFDRESGLGLLASGVAVERSDGEDRYILIHDHERETKQPDYKRPDYAAQIWLPGMRGALSNTADAERCRTELASIAVSIPGDSLPSDNGNKVITNIVGRSGRTPWLIGVRSISEQHRVWDLTLRTRGGLIFPNQIHGSELAEVLLRELPQSDHRGSCDKYVFLVGSSRVAHHLLDHMYCMLQSRSLAEVFRFLGTNTPTHESIVSFLLQRFAYVSTKDHNRIDVRPSSGNDGSLPWKDLSGVPKEIWNPLVVRKLRLNGHKASDKELSNPVEIPHIASEVLVSHFSEIITSVANIKHHKKVLFLLCDDEPRDQEEIQNRLTNLIYHARGSANIQSYAIWSIGYEVLGSSLAGRCGGDYSAIGNVVVEYKSVPTLRIVVDRVVARVIAAVDRMIHE